MKDLQRYVGQKAEIVMLYSTIAYDGPAGGGQNEVLGQHLEKWIAELQDSDAIFEGFALKFPDGTIFFIECKGHVDISKNKKEILLQAKKRAEKQLQSLNNELKYL